ARIADDEPEAEVPFGLPGARRLALDRLSADEGLELARTLLGPGTDIDDRDVARAIADEAAGHPLFVDELVRHAQFLGGVAPAGVRLDDALFSRVSRLDAPARKLLDVVAVAGVALAHDVAVRAAGISTVEAAPVAQTLRTAHLARTAGSRGLETIEPYHDRVREAVVARLDPKVRRDLHEAIARALESRGVLDADALSAHWLGAGDASKAAEYARKAADQAFAALAFDRAAALYARALALGTSDEAGRQALRVRLGESLANSGHGAEAARAFGEASERETTPDQALELRRRAAEELLTAGLLDEGSDMLRAVLRAVAIGMPTTSIGALLSLLFYRLVLWIRGDGYVERAEHQLPARVVRRHDACSSVARALSAVDTIRGAYFQTRVMLFALELGEATRLASALAFEAVAVAASGPRRATRAMRLVADSAAIAQRTLDPKATGVASIAAGYAYFLQGRFRESLSRCDQGGEILRVGSPGSFWERRMAFTGGAWALAWMGDVVELSKRVERGIHEAEHRGDIYSTTTLRTGLFGLVWLARGDAQGARAAALDAARAWTQRGYHS
ncbi:MAG TPA: ATP-binding protein, partial [Byssovorax sp.]